MYYNYYLVLVAAIHHTLDDTASVMPSAETAAAQTGTRSGHTAAAVQATGLWQAACTSLATASPNQKVNGASPPCSGHNNKKTNINATF